MKKLAFGNGRRVSNMGEDWKINHDINMHRHDET